MKGLPRAAIRMALIPLAILFGTLPLLARAAQRNLFALQVKPLAQNIEWVNPEQVCEPVVPTTLQRAPDCEGANGCYLNELAALRVGAWNPSFAQTRSNADALAVFISGWGAWCTISRSAGIEVWRTHAHAIGEKFYADAGLALRNGDGKRALASADIAQELIPGAQTHLLVGEAYERLDAKQEALKEYRAGITFESAPAELYYRLAEVEWKEGDTAAARGHLEQALKINDKEWLYQHRYGSLVYELKEWAQAEQAFQRAVKLNPKNGDSWAGVALSQFQQGHFDAAQTAIAGILQYAAPDRQKAGYLAALAQIAVKQGNLQVAADVYEQALAVQPENTSLMAALIPLYVQMGNCTGAETTYQKLKQVQTAQQKTVSPPPACPGKP